MKTKKKALVLIFILELCMIVGIQTVKASQGDIYVSIVNKIHNYEMTEAVLKIKNNSRGRISVNKIILQKKEEQKWIFVKEKKNKGLWAESRKAVYTNINVANKLTGGQYRFEVYIKTKMGVEIKKYIDFYAEPEVVDKNDNINDNKPQAVPSRPPVTYYKSLTKGNIKHILLNGDFKISRKGKINAIIFSETDYARTYSTRIELNIQRKGKRGYKSYKKYIQLKNSNIGYLNKTLRVKKSGKYRMKVTIISYKKSGGHSTKIFISKPKRYKKMH